MGFKVSFGGIREKVAEPVPRFPQYTPEAEVQRGCGSRAGGEGTPNLRVGAGGQGTQPCPRGQAGTGSQEQRLLSVACQPHGCACDGSGGGVGPQCALLPGKKFFPGRGRESSSGALGRADNSPDARAVS